MPSVQTDREGNARIEGDLLLEAGKTVKVNGSDLAGSMLLSSMVVDTSIDTKQALYTVPAGKSCVVTMVVARYTGDDVSALADNNTLGFGVAADDWQGAFDVTPLSAANSIVSYSILNSQSVSGAATDTFGILINSPSVSSDHFTIDVFGYLF